MASSKGAAGVDNTSRKTWDKAEFADKASERDKKVRAELGGRVPLRPSSLTLHPAGRLFVQDKAAEDSALDARKRKRLGGLLHWPCWQRRKQRSVPELPRLRAVQSGTPYTRGLLCNVPTCKPETIK